jgi:ankyrin repeat protein
MKDDTGRSLTPAEAELLAGSFDAARSGDADALAPLLAHGLPPNLTNERGDTLLMLASYHHQAATVDLLLAHGADVERINDRGQTALGAATFTRDVGIVNRLLAAGADPDGGGRSARSIAEFFELDEMSALLNAESGPAADAGDS